jgi:hypothetical protein
LLLLAFASSDAVAEQAPTPEASGSRPGLLGREESVLREEFGAALESQPIEQRRGFDPGQANMPSEAVEAGKDVAGGGGTIEPKDPFVEQLRLRRKPAAGNIQRVEYELFRSRVYRVRWQFVERFERPLMPSVVAHFTTTLGKPYYDQLIEGKFGTGRATLRRAGWRRGSQTFEVRQLNPQVGGPIYLTLSDLATIGTIVESGGTVAPEPDSIGPWWQKPVKSVEPLTASGRDDLLVAFDEMLAEVRWERGATESE